MALTEPLIASNSPSYTDDSSNSSHHGNKPAGLFFSDVVVAAGSTEIVHGASGWVAPGEILALMGPSGSGKSTLLDVLARKTEVGAPVLQSGSIQFNGRELSTVKYYRRQAAYVTQEDILMPTLTVQETLYFYARLRLALSPNSLAERVTTLLAQLRLSHCADTMVGGMLPGGFALRGISGGEKRRLALACGLITNPTLILADEITSGLDAENALFILTLLKDLCAKRGTMLVCAIHQPRSSVFRLFDRVLVVAKGQPAFLGAPAEIATTMAELTKVEQHPLTSPADFALDALQATDVFADASLRMKLRNAHRSLTQEAMNTTRTVSSTSDDGTVEVPHRWQRFTTLLWRTKAYFLRNIGNTLARLVVATFLGVLIGLVFLHSSGDQHVDKRLKALYFTSLIIVLLPFQSISLFQDSRQYFLRERAAELYACGEFFAAALVLEAIVVVASACLLAIPIYWMIGFHSTAGTFFINLVTFILMYLTSSTFMTLLSNLTPNMDLSFALGAFFMTVFFLFAGFFVRLSELPGSLAWINYFNWVRFGFQALVINELEHNALGRTIIQDLDFDSHPHGKGAAIGILVLWYLAFVGQSFLALKYFPRLRGTKLFRLFSSTH
eukprot:m.91264 g.91264  ORF g.91264 m.91264 type:complete len:614 (+) comp14904_c0_seq1:40-1881(+)